MRESIAFWVAVLGCLATTAAVARAGTKQYTFTNNTGQPANDLHIEFNQAVTFTPNPPAPFTVSAGSGTANVDFSGGSVAAGGVVVVSFTTSGSGPTIKRGWWTLNGQSLGNLGPANTDPWR